ncbi:MAG TPA: hypothetical protein PLA80_13640 [Synergistaceae bacterium]|nr:hypothetical protein [Synergistaceae bacterium]
MRLLSSITMKKNTLLLCAACLFWGTLLSGGCGLRKETPSSSAPKTFSSVVAVPVRPKTVIPGKSRDGKIPGLRPLSPPTPTLAPIPGVGGGKAFSHGDIPGKDLSLQELALVMNHPAPKKKKDILSSRDLGMLGEIADSVQDFRDSLEESTLREGSKALNALPLVYAEPDKATVDYSGGTFSIGISIPVERLRIGKPLDPESKDTPASQKK